MIKPPLMDDQILPEATMVLKALADPNRLRIFNMLMEGDSCNGELNERLGLPPNLLSHHLRVLREAGLVYNRHDAVDARWIYYAVDKEAVTRWLEWFASCSIRPASRNGPFYAAPKGARAPIFWQLRVS